MTTAAIDQDSSAPRALSNKGIALGALAGAVAGAIGNVVLFFIGSAAGVTYAADLQRTGTIETLPVAQVAIASIVPAIPALLLGLALNRFTRKPALIFTVIAVLFAVFSMGGPAGLVGASVGMKVVLALMHVVSGVAITAGLLRGGAAR